ncbi:PfkB family carbohydrate kinase [Arthrobacter sp. M4]|uniref:PfkB family carbohydrate kinase n=1 Tax=Arthrobacter sp. M4 TaxID=218160 RepID=UPI001CDD4501|nr:PfkB family carbohydrate kinase [Arthrobacter sp. M4]MCA4135183.1 PfkB family carbohydrate kinase [Arthrobacter sp. M4]
MRVTVVGDVLLDVDINGRSTRLSPDAPVPVVDVDEVRRRAGGAGLVATLLAQDGHDVGLVTALSDDAGALHLRRILAGSGVTVLAGRPLAPTPTKTRVRNGQRPVVRYDQGCAPAPVPDCTAKMLAAIASAEAIVVADYGRGITANREIRAALAEVASRVPIVWDPHPSGSQPVAGVAVVTPNLSEALASAGMTSDGPVRPASAAAARHLKDLWSSNAVLVTVAEDGAVLVQGKDSARDAVTIPAPKTTVDDPCGAGDRLAGSLAIYLAERRSLVEAAALAVAEASGFLAAGGAAALAGEAAPPAAPSAQAASTLPLLWGPSGQRAGNSHRSDGQHGAGVPDGVALASAVRAAGGTVVATGGCFDLLHAGHARTLAAARKLGDCLIVCLNTDASVRRLKGPRRPIVSEEDRAELLLALECVDAVILFDEDTPEACLSRFQPDLWVKGGDYNADELPESRLLASWGGRCLTVPYHPARSTSGLAEALARVG